LFRCYVCEVLDPNLGDNSATDTDLVLGTCGFPDDLLLAGLTVDSTRVFTACGTITTGPGFEIVPGGAVTLRAGQGVLFTDDSSVGLGASLSVEIDPLLSE